MAEENKSVIAEKYLGKGKTGKYCPFRQGHYCNTNCGLFMESLGSCCIHGINWNLKKLNDVVGELKENINFKKDKIRG